MKKLLAIIAAATVAALIGVNSPANAACTAAGSSNKKDNAATAANEDTDRLATAPGTGSEVYGSQTGATSGYLGVEGSTGYIEAGGGQSGGTIQGRTSDGKLDGRINVDATPGVCVNQVGQG